MEFSVLRTPTETGSPGPGSCVPVLKSLRVAPVLRRLLEVALPVPESEPVTVPVPVAVRPGLLTSRSTPWRTGVPVSARSEEVGSAAAVVTEKEEKVRVGVRIRVESPTTTEKDTHSPLVLPPAECPSLK